MSTPTLPNLNDQAVNQVFDRLVSLALETGYFQTVNQHEPKSSPGQQGIHCAVWAQSIKPALSSINAVSILVLFDMRIYKSFTSQPFDYIDPAIMSGTMTIMAALCGDFQFGGIANAREIDLLGMEGTPLNATAGYVEIDRKMYRVMTIAVPVVFNDAFTEEP